MEPQGTPNDEPLDAATADALLDDLRDKRRRLLRQDEERILGELIRHGRLASDELDGAESPSRRRELESWVQRGREAAVQFELHNLRLVRYWAKKAVHQGLAYEDLVQEGWFGLRRAVELFDPSLGLKFSTYASWWIKQSMSRAIADKSRTIRLPVHVHEKLAKVVRIKNALLTETGSAPVSAISEESGMSDQTVRELLSLARGPASLDSPLGDGLNTLGDVLPDRSRMNFEEMAHRTDVVDRIHVALSSLPGRDAAVVKRRYGFDGGAEETLEEIGSDLNLTRERIRQIQKRSLQRLAMNRGLKALIAS